MSTGTATAAASIINPLERIDQVWGRPRYRGGARTATVELQVSERTMTAADEHSVRFLSASVPDILEAPELLVTINRIRAFDQEECDEDRPSAFAFGTTMSVLTQAAQSLKREFPRGSASVGVGEGLRLTWRLAKGEIRLIVDGARASQSYIYVEPREGDSYVENAISGDRLAALLRLLG